VFDVKGYVPIARTALALYCIIEKGAVVAGSLRIPVDTYRVRGNVTKDNSEVFEWRIIITIWTIGSARTSVTVPNINRILRKPRSPDATTKPASGAFRPSPEFEDTAWTRSWPRWPILVRWRRRGLNNIEAQVAVPHDVSTAGDIRPQAFDGIVPGVDYPAKDVCELQAKMKSRVMKPCPPNAIIVEMTDIINCAIIGSPGSREINT
jgi:hypothetical protein